MNNERKITLGLAAALVLVALGVRDYKAIGLRMTLMDQARARPGSAMPDYAKKHPKEALEH